MTEIENRGGVAVVARERDGGILCSDLVRIYSGDGVEVQALQGLNLQVDGGELVAIVGASGSGKSTLLGILSGLDKQTAGKAVVAGRDLLTMTRAQRLEYRRRAVGFIWQQTERNLLPYLTARENIAMAMNLAGTRDRDRRSTELLELLEIGDKAERMPAELSGGEQQRVAIAVSLANEPLVLLADEPTGELDDATSVEVLEVMRSVNRELGVTTLIVTHDPTVAEHVRRTVLIRDGRTSTEVFRSHGEGGEHAEAEEFTVIDRSGRLQLPAEYVTRLQLRDRVRLELEPTHVRVSPAARPSQSPSPERAQRVEGCAPTDPSTSASGLRSGSSDEGEQS
ncbi:ABC transporter ATP-binding protein [Humibacter sp. RRB41]|uniref:ABC transporter ATP-binding protein n=1 Tax=Humibacter sp. RRB41 TaxID=2919946 RepID=UPI001FAA69AD|nr:ABC transporter ATP-binding protein [Humibacter sp. RRB41]